ncbi:MAG: FkbM family methyltransferase [Vicinamibacterales bacterium]
MILRRLTRVLLVLVVLAAVATGSGYMGLRVGRQYERNRLCCDTPRPRNLWLSAREVFGQARFYSQIGQDKWVLETVFPDVKNGFFLDVGSGDGTQLSNTKALEEHGWRGICIDPFPTNMEGRTCQMLKEVVFSESGKRMQFQASGEVGGIRDTLGKWKGEALGAPTVEFTTVTLRDVLENTRAPKFIHFVSLDIEGAELEALKAFPFDQYKIGAMAVEHNDEEPKRTEIEALMRRHGYRRVHSWQQDDFYVPERGR